MIELREPIESVYFNWLCAKITNVRANTPALTYWKLMRELQNTEFVWLVSMDDNRCEDGKELRHEFIRETGIETDREWLNIECSVLEMLIAFSRRAAYATDRSAKHWFWEFLRNLGLSDFNDATFVLSPVTDILYVMIWRTYDYNGQGGMFPIRHPHEDQRKVELWYQFNQYVFDHKLI